MGSGNSRLNGAEREAVPIKNRPTIAGRFEEYRKRRNGESKKQLLKEEDGSVFTQSSHETYQTTEDHGILITKETQVQPSKEEMEMPIETTEKKPSSLFPISNLECETEEEEVEVEKESLHDNNDIEQVSKDIDPNQDKVIHDDDDMVEAADIKTEEGNFVEIPENKQQVKAKSDDNDSDDSEFERLLFPGSPSFRIYCIEAEEERKEDEECKSPTDVMHNNVESAASRNSKQERIPRNHVVAIESSTKRKGNKMKKFGHVKTLLKVKSCYYPCTCTGDHRRQLVAAKTVN